MSRFSRRGRLVDRGLVTQIWKTIIRASVAAGALALVPSISSAQDPPPRLTVAANVGVANPFHGDFDFNAPAWEVSMRGALGTHAAAEFFVEEWQHRQTTVSLDQLITGPSGPLGRIARFEQRTTYRMRSAGVNVLATGGSGRVSFFGGGGVGLLAYARRFTSSATGCDAGTGLICQPSGNTFTSESFTVQGVGEMDVTVVPRIQWFGRAAMVVPVSDPGFGHATLSGGVRIVVW